MMIKINDRELNLDNASLKDFAFTSAEDKALKSHPKKDFIALTKTLFQKLSLLTNEHDFRNSFANYLQLSGQEKFQERLDLALQSHSFLELNDLIVGLKIEVHRGTEIPGEEEGSDPTTVMEDLFSLKEDGRDKLALVDAFENLAMALNFARDLGYSKLNAGAAFMSACRSNYLDSLGNDYHLTEFGTMIMMAGMQGLAKGMFDYDGKHQDRLISQEDLLLTNMLFAGETFGIKQSFAPSENSEFTELERHFDTSFNIMKAICSIDLTPGNNPFRAINKDPNLKAKDVDFEAHFVNDVQQFFVCSRTHSVIGPAALLNKYIVALNHEAENPGSGAISEMIKNLQGNLIPQAEHFADYADRVYQTDLENMIDVANNFCKLIKNSSGECTEAELITTLMQFTGSFNLIEQPAYATLKNASFTDKTTHLEAVKYLIAETLKDKKRILKSCAVTDLIEPGRAVGSRIFNRSFIPAVVKHFERFKKIGDAL